MLPRHPPPPPIAHANRPKHAFPNETSNDSIGPYIPLLVSLAESLHHRRRLRIRRIEPLHLGAARRWGSWRDRRHPFPPRAAPAPSSPCCCDRSIQGCVGLGQRIIKPIHVTANSKTHRVRFLPLPEEEEGAPDVADCRVARTSVAGRVSCDFMSWVMMATCVGIKVGFG